MTWYIVTILLYTRHIHRAATCASSRHAATSRRKVYGPRQRAAENNNAQLPRPHASRLAPAYRAAALLHPCGIHPDIKRGDLVWLDGDRVQRRVGHDRAQPSKMYWFVQHRQHHVSNLRLRILELTLRQAYMLYSTCNTGVVTFGTVDSFYDPCMCHWISMALAGGRARAELWYPFRTRTAPEK